MKKIVLFVSAFMFLLLAVIGSQLMVTVAVPTGQPGVSPGEWYYYTVTYCGNGTMPSPNEKLVWLNTTILEVTGTNVTFESRAHFADDHESAGIGIVDVDTGQGNGTGTIIAKNLYQGDLIYESPPLSGSLGVNFQGLTINGTIFHTYLGTSVEVNNLTITRTPWPMTNQTLSFYWNRTTGMQNEVSLYQVTQEVYVKTWIYMDIVITDVGLVPEFPPVLILPLLIIATIAAVFLGKTTWSTKKLLRKPSPYA